MEQQFDVVVIGAGSAGLTSAVGLSKVGKRVLLVEREHMGGECTNSGCVPSKALLHHAKTFHTAQKIAGATEQAASYRGQAFTYVRDTINEILAEEQPEHFEAMGITVVSGEAEFVSKCAIKVGDTTYRYKKAIIATGSQPRLIDIPGLAESDTLTNQNLFTLDQAPEKLLVIGGGPIGLEMAQALALLGSQVTIIERNDSLAKTEDPAVRTVLMAELEKLGITYHTSASVTAVNNRLATISHAEGETELLFDKVLVAIGRVPTLPNGLEAAGINYDERCIMVDKQYRTSNKYVYAIGDVAQRLKFTHTADDTARQVVARIASKGWLRINRNKAVPKVTYTQPEIAQVGLSETEAEAKFGAERIMRIEVPFSQNDRAKTDAATTGTLVVIARRLTGTVLGAHIIGPRAGELLSVFTIAIDRNISMYKLQQTIFAYPTYNLIIKKAADQFLGRQLAELKPDLIATVKRAAPKIIAAIFWGALIYGFQSYRISNDLSYQDVLFDLVNFLTGTAWGPILYILIYAIRPLVLFPATLMTALSGALFGPFLGILYTVIGENMSANLAYGVGRFFGKGLKLEDTVVGTWVTALRENTFGAVLFMRLAYFPFDLTNYASGVVQAKWREYFLATLIGIMPGLTVFVLFGAGFRDNLAELQEKGFNFESVDTNVLGISVAIFIVSLLLSRYLKRWRAAQ